MYIYTQCLRITLRYSVCWKNLLLTSVTDGIIIKITVENTHVMKIVCKNICMITTCLVINIFFYTVSVTFIDKTDPSKPLEREQYWRHILQTNAPHGLNIADGV